MKTNPSAVVLATAMVVFLTGCTSVFYEVKPLAAGPPPKVKPTVLVLGDIQLTDVRISEPERTMMVQVFRLGVETWCVAHHAFEIRRESAPASVPADALVLNGTITEVEKGSEALRFWLGGGAGQVRVMGEFAVHAAEGTRLTSFVARRSYLGGHDMEVGGPDVLKPQGVVGKLGELVGETTDRWARGKKIGQKK